MELHHVKGRKKYEGYGDLRYNFMLFLDCPPNKCRSIRPATRTVVPRHERHAHTEGLPAAAAAAAAKKRSSLVHYLAVLMRVPVRVEQDTSVRRAQVDAQTTGPRRQQEHEKLRIAVELLDLLLSVQNVR